MSPPRSFRISRRLYPERYVTNPNHFPGARTIPDWCEISRELPSHEQAVAMSTACLFHRIPQILSRSAVRLQPVDEEAKAPSTRGRFPPNADRNVKSCESRNPVSEFYGPWAVAQPETRDRGRRTLDLRRMKPNRQFQLRVTPVRTVGGGGR